MIRIVFAALTAAALAAGVASPALADDPHHDGPTRMHRPAVVNRMAPHHHPVHCTIRHHHRICR